MARKGNICSRDWSSCGRDRELGCDRVREPSSGWDPGIEPVCGREMELSFGRYRELGYDRERERSYERERELSFSVERELVYDRERGTDLKENGKFLAEKGKTGSCQGKGTDLWQEMGTGLCQG